MLHCNGWDSFLAQITKNAFSFIRLVGNDFEIIMRMANIFFLVLMKSCRSYLANPRPFWLTWLENELCIFYETFFLVHIHTKPAVVAYNQPVRTSLSIAHENIQLYSTPFLFSEILSSSVHNHFV